MANNIQELLYDRVLDITACINIPLKLFAIYVLLRHTPPPLRHYSFFILNTMIWNFVGNVVFSFMHLVPLFPAYCFRVDGISRLFIDSELFGHLMFLLMFIFVNNFGLALVFIFPHRYIVFAHPKLAARIRPAWVFGLCGGVHAALILFGLIYSPIVEGIFSYDDYQNKAELPDRPFVFCFNPNGTAKTLFNTTYMLGLIVEILVIVGSSILFLRKIKKMKKRIFHDATLDLQKKVFSSLVILTVIAIVFCFTPVPKTAMICIVILSNHGSVAAIAYLLFFKAYRDAVTRIFSNSIATLTGRKSKVHSVVTSAGNV